ncbi:phosphoribosylformylglycinamidine cyclo-ligase [Candidatus Microgenomates bacterium]|nr:MAG: phosphoribosylformylglycinamidine cyclo-ligase [Candidatus Microgenomates bacterium]
MLSLRSSMTRRKNMNKQTITYSQVGDNYDTKDPIKKLAQNAAKETSVNLKNNGFEEVSDTRGESAFVWDQGNVLMASVVEGLGTKNLIADETRKITNKTYYDIVGHDTVATVINDLITVGAKPLVIHAYWAVEDNEWLADKERMSDLINGWKNACDLSGATWGGGETATMKQIVVSGTSELAGSAVGIIEKKENLITDKKLKAGDRILFLKSNGVNANGISLTRAVAKKLPKGYGTKLPSGQIYGEVLLTKTNIYANLIQDLLNNEVDIHYISNITGHGLRKVMRARQDFKYVIEKILPPQEVFLFIQEQANLSDEEMYGTYNMGMDYAIFVPEKDIKKAQEIVIKNKFESIDAGYIENGERQVVITPKNITFKSERLDLR